MASGARTIEDLERKYNFAKLLGLASNVKMQSKSIVKVENELINMLNSLIINLKDVLNSQSEVSLWFYSGTPTISNKPYADWTTPSDHDGDIYYDQATGYVYQYKHSNAEWVLNTDTNLIQAMVMTNVEIDTTDDNERKVYFAQPSPPYSSGDWWIKTDGSLFVCQLGRAIGTYQEDDFIVATKYTPTVASVEGDVITVKRGQVIKMSDVFASFTDLATGGSTIINGENITTGSIKSQNYIENQSGTKIDLEDGTIDTKNFKVDEDGNVNLENGATVISEKGLMNTYTYDTKGFKIVGFMGDDIFSPTKANKESVTIDFIIPEGLNITKAFVYLFHTPMYWGTNNSYVWGWCRNLKLYKANNMYSRQIVGEYFGGYNENDNTVYDEITGAFGTNGFTAQTASDSSHITEKTVSEDISEVLKDESGNTISGLHQLRIESDFNFTEELTQENIVSKTGFVFAVLRIDGFMTYENLKSKEIMTENNINIVSEDNKNIITEGL